MVLFGVLMIIKKKYNNRKEVMSNVKSNYQG